MTEHRSDADRRHDDDRQRASDDKKRASDDRRGVRLAIVILIASAIVIAMGWQQHLSNKNSIEALRTAQSTIARQDAQLVCVKAWAHEFTATTRTRVDARGALDRATKARNDALDDVLLVVIGVRQDPPTANNHDFDKALHHYQIKLDHLHRVEARVTAVGNRNPYPQLRC